MTDIRKDPFSEYIRQIEPSRKKLGYAWYTAIGLQAVDSLRTSEYLRKTAQDNIEGKISLHEANRLIESYYRESAEHCQDRTQEADKVSARMPLAKVIHGQLQSFSSSICE